MQVLRGIIDTQKASSLKVGAINAGDSLSIELTLKMNGAEINLDEATFELLSRKSDGNEVRQKENITFSNSVVNIVCRQQISTCSGLVTNQLIIKSEGRISTCLFYFYVGRSLEREILQSVRDVEVLDQLEEYVSIGFNNLKEFENRLVTAEENIRALDSEIKGNEEKRNAAESNRTNQEQTRVSNETNRSTAETERDRQEENRSTNEDRRVEAETNRNSSEATRVNNEKYRAAEEDKRKSAETNRVNAESNRVNNETNRSTAENNRKTAESNRVSAETSRVNAESKRVENFNAMKLENDSFKDDVDSKVSSMQQANTTFKEDVNAKVGGIEQSYFGEKQFPTGREALNDDLEHLNRRMNDAQLLEYNGASLMAGNSYSGMTDDLTIKGRTLQNLCPKNHIVDFKSGVLWQSKFLMAVDSKKPNYNRATLPIKPNTTYTLVANIKKNTSNFEILIHNVDSAENGKKAVYFETSKKIPLNFSGIYVTSFISKSDFSDMLPIDDRVVLRTQSGNMTSGEILIEDILLLEGDYTNTPIRELLYIDGIQSVGELVGDKYKVGTKSHGLNSINYKEHLPYLATFSSGFPFLVNPNVDILNNLEYVDNGYKITTTNNFWNQGAMYLIPLKPNTDYIVSSNAIVEDTMCVCKIQGVNGDEPLTTAVKEYDNFLVNVEKIPNGNFYRKFNSGKFSFARVFLGGSWSESMTGSKKYIFTNIQLEEVPTTQAQPTPYEPYKEDIKAILLNEPLRSLPNGVCDEVLDDGTEIRRVGKIILNGSENWGTYGNTSSQTTTIAFALHIPNINGNWQGKGDFVSDRFTWINDSDYYSKDVEGIRSDSNSNGRVLIRILKSKLQSQTLDGFKQWLQTNNTTIYYELKEPVITKHNKVMNLKTYEGATHIHSTNTLPSKITCKVPTNVQAVIQSLSIENKKLNNKLKNTQSYTVNEVENLTSMDTNLVATSWDMDFRLCDIEWALEEITNSKTIDKIKLFTTGGINNMALSRYEQAKIMILGGVYEREKLTYQLDTYLKRGYITQAEYDDLISLMDARETVEAIK